MKAYEREALLDRADRDSVSVGTRIPRTVQLDGDEFDLAYYAFDARLGVQYHIK